MPMPFQFERIKNSDGGEDSTIIDFDNKPHFAISFGTEIQIFDLQNCIYSFKPKFYVQKILSFQKHYFLLGKSSYCICKDRNIINQIEFPRKFSKILKVLNLKNSFIFIFDQRKFLTGTINNYRLEFDTSLNDNHFFNVLSAAVVNDKMNVLVSTFSKRFMIVYNIEGVSCLKSVRREIQNGNVLVPRKEDFLLFDEQGMWQYGTKLTFIKEFANYKIVSSIDDLLRTIVFCENGEVIVINKDNSHFTAGFLDCPITSVSLINGLFLCTSIFYSYFIRINENIEIISSFGSFNKDESLLSIKSGMTNKNNWPYLELASQKTFKKIEFLIKSCEEPDHKLHNKVDNKSITSPKLDNELLIKSYEEPDHKVHNKVDNTSIITPKICNNNDSIDLNASFKENLKSFDTSNTNLLPTQQNMQSFDSSFISSVNGIIEIFKKYNFKSCLSLDGILILNFDGFSVFKNHLILPILNVHKFNQLLFVFTSTSFFCFENEDSKIKFLENSSEIIKSLGNLIVSYSERQIKLFNLDKNSIHHINVTFDLCDFTLSNEILYCIDINEELHMIDIQNSLDMFTVSEMEFKDCTFQELLFKNENAFISIDSVNEFINLTKSNRVDTTKGDHSSGKYNQNLSIAHENKLEDFGTSKESGNSVIFKHNSNGFITNTPFSLSNQTEKSNEINQQNDFDQITKKQCILDQNYTFPIASSNYDLIPYTSQGFLCVNGKIFTVINDSLSLLLNIKKFIYNVNTFKSYLIISADKTFIFNLKTKELLKATEVSFWSFIYEDRLCLCSKAGIKDFTFFKADFYFKYTNFHLESSERLISLFSHHPVLSDLTVDQKGFKMKFFRSSILFKDSFLNCFSQIRKNLICLGSIDLNGMGSITFISLSKKNIKIRKKIELNDIPFSICSLNNRICIICSTHVIWYKLEYGKIVFKGKIHHNGICKDSQFINKNEILLRNMDWSFCIVNLKTKKVNNFATEGAAIPFVISGQEGYGVGSQIYISKQVLECGQSIDKIYSFGNFILIFCINGSIFSLKTVEDEQVKSLYENEPVIISNN